MHARGSAVGCLFVTLTLSLLASTSPLHAQVAAGEITGIVKDQAGAVVPGATVTVTNVETNRQRVVVSTADGVYTATSARGPFVYQASSPFSATVSPTA